MSILDWSEVLAGDVGSEGLVAMGYQCCGKQRVTDIMTSARSP